MSGSSIGVQLDLRGQVVASVLLVPHRDGGVLRVAQVQTRVGVVDTAGNGLLVVAGGEHMLSTLAHDDGGSGVLAHRQNAGSGDIGVLEQIERDELVVVRRFGIVEDARELRQVIRAQVMRDVVQRRFGQQAHRFRLDLQEGAAVRSLDCRHPFGGEQSVLGGVITDRQQVLIEEVGHHLS